MCLIPKYKTRRQQCPRDGPPLPRTNYQIFRASDRDATLRAKISASCGLSVRRELRDIACLIQINSIPCGAMAKTGRMVLS